MKIEKKKTCFADGVVISRYSLHRLHFLAEGCVLSLGKEVSGIWWTALDGETLGLICLLFNGISTFLSYLMLSPFFLKDSNGII